MNEIPGYEVLIASDITNRDGIELEIWEDNELLIEVFRDDSKLEHQITLYKKDLPLSLVEKAIEMFHRRVVPKKNN